LFLLAAAAAAAPQWDKQLAVQVVAVAVVRAQMTA
jgi:hypothetical protein